MKKLFFFLLLVLPGFAFSQQLLSPGKFKKGIAQKDIQLVDVRTAKEFESGHIDRAQHIDYFSAGFKEQLVKLDKEKAVYVYCQGGGRSAEAAKMLVDLGFKKVFDLKGGYENWKE